MVDSKVYCQKDEEIFNKLNVCVTSSDTLPLSNRRVLRTYTIDPFAPRGFPLDKQECLALGRRKSTGSCSRREKVKGDIFVSRPKC